MIIAPAEKGTWPDGARVAVMLSFDFDAETMWLARDPTNIDRLGVTSQGTFGAKVGVPRILQLLREAEVPATFFVPGWTVERYTDRVHDIMRDGHEIGHHGYLHRWSDPEQPGQDIEELEKGFAACERLLGFRPKGYRAPAGEVTPHLLECLSRYGFVYDSSLQDDVDPYRIALANGSLGPIELPWHWSISDATHALTSLRNPKPVFPNSHLFELFSDEFREVHRWGGLFNLVMHPQVMGRPPASRCFVRRSNSSGASPMCGSQQGARSPIRGRQKPHWPDTAMTQLDQAALQHDCG